MPDFNTSQSFTSSNNSSNTWSSHQSDCIFSESDECEAVRDYFKELSSIYELCRLGLHRPALRIAPEQGFVRVPLLPNPKATNTTSTTKPKVKVDPWFTQIQCNKQTRQLGRHLKAYAKAFKTLALKIAQGHASTMTTTVESSFFNYNKAKSGGLGGGGGSGGSSANPAATATSFQSTITPTISSINLDRTIFEEAKLSKYEPNISTNQITSNPVTNTPSLSNLLTQPIGNDMLLGQSGSDFTTDSLSEQQQQAQSLTAFSSTQQSNNDCEKNEAYTQQQQQYQQQQAQLNQLSSGSNLTQIAHLTANMSVPPALFVYVIDPFDYYLFNKTSGNKMPKKNNEEKLMDMDNKEQTDDSDLDDGNF